MKTTIASADKSQLAPSRYTDDGEEPAGEGQDSA